MAALEYTKAVPIIRQPRSCESVRNRYNADGRETESCSDKGSFRGANTFSTDFCTPES